MFLFTFYFLLLDLILGTQMARNPSCPPPELQRKIHINKSFVVVAVWDSMKDCYWNIIGQKSLLWTRRPSPGNKPETSAPFSLSSHVFLCWTLFTGQLEERTTTGDLSGRRDRSLHSFLSRKKAQTQLMLTLDFLAQLTWLLDIIIWLFPGEGNGNPLQYSCLENFMDRGVHGVAKSWTRLSD